MTEQQERRPAPLYIYRPDDHAPLDAEGLAWLADQLCSEDRVHPKRTMASGWITTQAAYEFPALLDRLATARAEAEALRGEVERLRAERDQMHALAKANNDLAKMQKGQIQDFRQSQLRLMNDLQACKDALAQWEGRHEPE